MFEREPKSTEVRLSGFGQKSVIVKYDDGSADRLPVLSIDYNRRADTVDIEAGDSDTCYVVEDDDGKILIGKIYLELPDASEIASLLIGRQTYIPVRTIYLSRENINN